MTDAISVLAGYMSTAASIKEIVYSFTLIFRSGVSSMPVLLEELRVSYDLCEFLNS